jgi:hypothetical protein
MAATDAPVHPEQAARETSREGLRLREDSVYTDYRGREKRSVRKRTDKALDKLKDALAKVLEPDETIFYVARAQAPVSVLEQLTFGWYIHTITGTVLVLTNRRLLHLLVYRNGSWKRSLRSLHLGDLAEAKVKGWLSPTLRLKYGNGKKETYWGLRRADAKKIKVLLAALLPGSVGESTPAQAMVSLCPDCLAALTPRVYQCGQCGLRFRDEKTMIVRSLQIPGGGYFYARQWFLGALDALFEAVILAFLMIWVLVALGMPEPFLQPLKPYSTTGEAWFVAGLLGLILVVEKLLTIYHGRRFVRDFMPAETQVGRKGWAVIGLVSYGLMALIVWAAVPNEGPLLQVAPDLAIQNAHFGLFRTDRDGFYQFTDTRTVPNKEGQQYGWVLRLRTSRETVSFKEEYFLLEPADVFAGQEAGEAGLAATILPATTNEDEQAPEGGLIASTWVVESGEPTGQRQIKIFLEGMLVETFTFYVR